MHPNPQGAKVYADAVQKYINKFNNNGMVSGFIYEDFDKDVYGKLAKKDILKKHKVESVIADENIKHLAAMGERDRFYITPENEIVEDGSSGAGMSSITYYEINNGFLIPLREYRFESPDFQNYTIRYSETYNGKEFTDWTYVDEMGTYEKIPVDLIPLSSYTPSDAANNNQTSANNGTYLDQLNITDFDQYGANEGDSFVYPIGKHEFTRGNICTDGTTYEHGIERWIARWNYSDEASWAYSVFSLDKKYTSLSGECKLIESYNTTDFDTTPEFWSDDKLIQSYHLTPNKIPFSINLDVTNCDKLKIYAYDNTAKSGGTSFGLVNMQLDTAA